MQRQIEKGEFFVKIYNLIYLEDGSTIDAAAAPFLTMEAAQAAMKDSWEACLKILGIDPEEEQTEEHNWTCGEDFASIRDDLHSGFTSWKITEHNLDVQVAVKVFGGQVQQIIANAGVSAKVYDLDVSDFPDEGEQEAADSRAAEYEKLQKMTGWSHVW